MANIIEYLKRIQPVYRRSSNKMKILVIVFILLGIAGLFVLRAGLSGIQAENAALEGQAAQLEQTNSDLQDNIDALGSVQSVEQIAQDELGLVDPDTVIVQPGE